MNKHIFKIIFSFALLSYLVVSCDTEQKPKVYTVKFHANGATGTPPVDIIVEDKDFYSHWNRIKLPDKGNLNYEGKQFYG